MSKYEKALKEYFTSHNSVLMAFIFGSQAKKTARRSSDWDIAVYLKEENRDIEQKIWSDVEKIVNAEVDLVVLNRAPASLAWAILRAGAILTVKNRGLYLSFMLKVSHEANDWYYTARKYHQIFERSASLSEEDRGRLERSLQFLEQEISDFDKFKDLDWAEYESDRAKKREVERWAEQIVNAVIDIAETILASERRPMPETYRLIIQVLGSVPPFDAKLCDKLSSYVGLRNILAHEYLEYRWKEISIFISESRPPLELFIKAVKEFLAHD